MFREHLLQKLKEKQGFYRKVFHQLIHSKKIEPFLSKIEAKTLVIVGQKDKILHYSSVEVFKKWIPNITTRIFKDGPHVFSGSLLDEVIDTLKPFLKEHSIGK